MILTPANYPRLQITWQAAGTPESRDQESLIVSQQWQFIDEWVLLVPGAQTQARKQKSTTALMHDSILSKNTTISGRLPLSPRNRTHLLSSHSFKRLPGQNKRDSIICLRSMDVIRDVDRMLRRSWLELLCFYSFSFFHTKRGSFRTA